MHTARIAVKLPVASRYDAPMKSAVIAIVLLAACRPARGPTVVLHLVDPHRWSDEDRRFVASVGSVWGALGLAFKVTNDPARSAHPCPADWPW